MNEYTRAILPIIHRQAGQYPSLLTSLDKMPLEVIRDLHRLLKSMDNAVQAERNKARRYGLRF